MKIVSAASPQSSVSAHLAGFGLHSQAHKPTILQLYIPHRPAMDKYQQLDHIHTLDNGDINEIIQATGNHWRKIFVIFAKIASALDARQLPWKTYLQEHLLQASGAERLIFCEETIIVEEDEKNMIHLFSGKACGEIAGYEPVCHEIAAGFYQSDNGLGFITPYFDYRQLSNVKIDYLVNQIKAATATN